MKPLKSVALKLGHALISIIKFYGQQYWTLHWVLARGESTVRDHKKIIIKIFLLIFLRLYVFCDELWNLTEARHHERITSGSLTQSHILIYNNIFLCETVLMIIHVERIIKSRVDVMHAWWGAGRIRALGALRGCKSYLLLLSLTLWNKM